MYCLENIEHILFKCHLAKFVWEMFSEIFNLDSYPSSWDDFCSSGLRGKGPFPISLIIFIFSGFAWALWTSRNKAAIEKKIPRVPTDVVYSALLLIQKWSIKLKEKDQERVLQIKESITKWFKTLKPSNVLLSDVVEI